MQELYKETRGIIRDSRNMLETLECASTNTQLDPEASSSVVQTFNTNIIKLTQNATDLRRNLNREPPSRRQVWKARLHDLEDQISELRAGESRCMNKFRYIIREKQMRDDLLQRRHQHSTSMGAQNGNNVVISGMGEVENTKRLDDSTGIVGNIVGMGKDTLENLLQQKERMRGTRKKVLDILNSIGIDRQIITRIERRERSDMILMYALTLCMLLILGLAVIWKYHRRRHGG